ncbi:MAG: hypothetical protein WEA56_13610 [Balneolaceae bacterium]
MYVKSPLKKSNSKSNRRGISGGRPAERKRRELFRNGNYSGGSSSGNGVKPNSRKKEKKSKLPVFTPWKVILASFLFGVFGILYIGHVFSTQQVYQEVQQLQNEFNKTKRLYDEKRLAYDRLVGPKEIYQKAREQGFVNAGPADEIIYLEP